MDKGRDVRDVHAKELLHGRSIDRRLFPILSNVGIEALGAERASSCFIISTGLLAQALLVGIDEESLLFPSNGVLRRYNKVTPLSTYGAAAAHILVDTFALPPILKIRQHVGQK